MSLLAKFIPPIELPSFFRVSSYAAGSETTFSGSQTTLIVRWNVDGEPKEKITVVNSGMASLAEVVEAFPGTEVFTKTTKYKMARGIIGNIPLPPDWVLECGAAPGGLEGFLLTFDIDPNGDKKMHFEKHLEVTTVQLSQLEDLIKWINEARKIDRYKVGR